ncbi:phospholipase A2 inhibitor gamma subunit B-like [Podarcis raffonei]|uniref:phospholipase A2 inhibitor gamma subunit B-like n=1 Tax=Podarcis raffonei TaxID=65483 RepID=UPI0023298E8F|nr:phospholipase A2 inhibitor gamma subunit B-like [Podarcis raffonei]
MMKTLLSTCLLLGLLSPATSLTCTHCHENSTSCEAPGSHGCRDDQTCSSGALHNNIVPDYEVSTFQGCIYSNLCHSGDFSFSAAQGKFLQLKMVCCQTNECNKEPVHLTPREDLSPNGRQCPACFRKTDFSGKTGCPREGTVSCLANETKCINYSSRMLYRNKTANRLQFKGCATEDLCALDGKNFEYGHLLVQGIKAKCWNATISSKQIDLEG